MSDIWDSFGGGINLSKTKVKTAKAAVKEANLDWPVSKVPVYFSTKGDGFKRINRKYAIVRQDSEDALGVVGSVYTELQNEDAFNYMDEIVKAGHAKYYAAGEIKGGRKVWILVDMKQEADIVPGDKVKGYLLLVNGHDGLTTVDIGMINVREYTGATLRQALTSSDKRNFYSFKHTTRISGKTGTIQGAVKAVSDRFQRFVQAAQLLAGKKVEDKELREFLLRVDGIDPASSRADNYDNASYRRQTVIDNTFNDGPPAARGTLWNAIGSLAIYTDLSAPTRRFDGATRQESRLTSAWFGAGAAYKSKAMRMALSIAEGPKELVDYDSDGEDFY